MNNSSPSSYVVAPSYKVETDAKKFGRRLRKLRMERGLTQLQLGMEAGRDRSFISSLECGMKEPALTTMRHLADAMSLTMSELLDGI